MIQANAISPAAAAADAPALPLPAAPAAGFQSAVPNLGASLPDFGERFAQTAQADADTPQADAQPTEPVPVPPAIAPAPAAQPLAEQWLQGMESQRQAVVEAKTLTDDAAGDAPAPSPATVSAPVAAPRAVEWPSRPLPSPAEAEPPAQAAAPSVLPNDVGAGSRPVASEPRPFAPADAPWSEPVAMARPAWAPAVAATPASTDQPVVEQARSATASSAPLPTPAAAPAVTTEGVPVDAPRPQSAPAPTPQEYTLKLQAPEAKWGEQMLLALRDHVELQLRGDAQQTTIRLDPPELGSLEIVLSHEGGRLNVQLSAAHADVVRLLQQTSERLRQELTGHFTQVSVQVSADGERGQHGQGRQRPQWTLDVEPAVADSDAGRDRRPAQRRTGVLVTV